MEFGMKVVQRLIGEIVKLINPFLQFSTLGSPMNHKYGDKETSPF